MAEAEERFGLARVLEGHAGFRTVLGAEVFVLGRFVEADELGADERLAVDLGLRVKLKLQAATGVALQSFRESLPPEFGNRRQPPELQRHGCRWPHHRESA